MGNRLDEDDVPGVRACFVPCFHSNKPGEQVIL